LQNPDNKREILADDKLKRIFGTDRVSMFEMNKHLSKHLK
jgi:chromatin remodeling complex protein RSC6